MLGYKAMLVKSELFAMRSCAIRRATILVSIFLLCSGFTGVAEHRLAGRTMGTTYHIKIVAPPSKEADMTVVQKRIDRRLEQLNQSMSTYRDDSEISRFNKLPVVGQPFAISPDFLKVMMAADAIHDLTGGAWDGTVHPLIELWGFGRSGPIETVPSQPDIEKAMQNVGFQHIDVSTKGHLKKRRNRVTVNLASIAKGYGVDVIASLIRELGYRNFLVEIGGIQGRRYSHIIDPRNGYPVNNGVVSASVIAPNCTLADGMATALMILDPTEGVQLMNKVEGVEGLIVVRHSDGSFEDHFSKGMAHQ